MDCIVHGVTKSQTRPSNFDSLNLKQLLGLSFMTLPVAKSTSQLFYRISLNRDFPIVSSRSDSG